MSVPTYTQPEQEQSRRSRRTFWIIVATLSAIALIGLTAFVGVTASSAINPLKQKEVVAARYYLTIESGDYATAYSFLDRNATIDGQPVDQQSFIRLAEAADAHYGTVYGMVLSTQSDGTHVAVDRAILSCYDLHLVLKQENGAWKIISADGI